MSRVSQKQGDAEGRQDGREQRVADAEEKCFERVTGEKAPGTASVHEYRNTKLPALCIHPFPTLLWFSGRPGQMVWQ